MIILLVIIVFLISLTILIKLYFRKSFFTSEKYFIGLITRCKDEFFIKEFCNYYLLQGIDKIFIIDDDSDDKTIYNNLNNKQIKIFYENDLFKNNKKNQMDIVNKYYKKLKENFTWMISVDVDEFITTKKYSEKTIRQELQSTFKDVDCIKVPWVMMACNNRQNNPKSILLENIYRWNHDKKHINIMNSIPKFECRYNQIEVKCIFKAQKFNKIDIHHPSNPDGKVKIINSINKKEESLNPFYNNLREIDIRNAYLNCYHYRIISRENSKNKIKNAIYKKFTLDDVMSFDYPELIDETLKNKIKNKKPIINYL
jgi:hypothetical protein